MHVEGPFLNPPLMLLDPILFACFFLLLKRGCCHCISTFISNNMSGREIFDDLQLNVALDQVIDKI